MVIDRNVVAHFHLCTCCPSSIMSMYNDRNVERKKKFKSFHFNSPGDKQQMLFPAARENPIAITHSPYYGCTIRVRSKANVSYEGILDGISVNKDRIYLKNVRVKGNTTTEEHSDEEVDRLNEVMINHLINDLHIYDEVCLNVRDVEEIKLLQLPSSFEKSKEKLRSIDPCLVDIRLSSSDLSNGPTIRRDRCESIGLLSSSNDSSSSSWDNLNKISQEQRKKSNTLLAKKILSKKKPRPNSSPVRITITSKLNPDAAPFFVPQRSSAMGPTRVRYPPRFIPPRQMASLEQQQHVRRPTPPLRERLSVPNQNRSVRSSNSLRATESLPYQNNEQQHQPQRGPRTISGTSSGSNVSLELVQYDFEKANEEFRRYLELEELVRRRTSTDSLSEDFSSSSPSHSFFDRLSCSATTGTAVAYTEINELEKNRQTFGDDAFLFSINDADWSCD